jgi:hypothetical protein
LTWDEKAVREKVDRKHAGLPRRSRDAAKVGSAYLARKRDILEVNRTQLADARVEAGRLYKAMSRKATGALRRTSMERAAPGSRLLLDAAFLVPATKAAAFRSALRTHTRALRGSGIAVTLTGPWPPYNFIGPPSRGGDSARRA